MNILFAGLGIGALLGAVIWLYVSDRRRRELLTDEQRDKEDADMQAW